MTGSAQARSYDEGKLSPLLPPDPDWARSWVRFFLRQVPDSEGKFPELSPSDAEINANLLLDTVDFGEVTYFRPHHTAARLYLGNPELLRSEGGQGWSNTRRDAGEITGAWLAQGRAFDARIPEGVILPPFVEVTVGSGSGAVEVEEAYTPYAIGLTVGGL